MKNKKYSNAMVYSIIPLAIFLLIFEYILCDGRTMLFGIGNGSCIHGDLAVSIFDTGRYISMISTVIVVIIAIIFRKKSNKFFAIFLVISSIFVFVIPYGFVWKSFNIRDNDICKGGLWDSKYCQMKNGKCIKEFEDGKYEK